MNDGMRLPFENERSWPVQPLWTVFAPIARLADTSLPVLSVSIHSGISDKELSNEERERNVWLSEDRSKYQKVVPGDLVYNSMRAWQGGFGACQTLGLVSPAYGVLSPISTINTKFYELLFRTKGYIALFDTFSPGIIDFRKRLSWDRCKHMKVPVPPLEEQNRIVKFACNVGDKVHLVTQKLQQQLDLLNDYRQSLITRAVTKGLDPNVEMKDSGYDITNDIPVHWNTIKLQYICKITTGNQDTQDAVIGGKYPFYVRSPKIERTNLVTHSGTGILMAGDGVGAGKVFHYAEGQYGIHQRVYLLHEISDVIDPKFLFFYIKTIFSREVERGTAQSTVPSIRMPMLTRFSVCLPPKREQIEISNYCKTIEEKIESVSETIKITINALQEYRSSLISAAVTGQLAIEEDAE